MEQRFENTKIALAHIESANAPVRMSLQRTSRLPQNQPEMDAAAIGFSFELYLFNIS